MEGRIDVNSWISTIWIFESCWSCWIEACTGQNRQLLFLNVLGDTVDG